MLAKQDHDANTYEPGTLEFDTTYYWRVDEVSGAEIQKGDVWGFTTDPFIAITDPNLVGWWKFDEVEGTIAVDSSGHYNHSTLINDPQWANGQLAGALLFDGVDDYVDLPIGPLIPSLTRSTIAVWVNFSNDGGAWQKIFSISTDTDNYMYLSPRTGDNMDQPMFVEISPVAGGLTSVSASSGILASGWHHVAVTLDPDDLQLCLDGEGVGTALSAAVLSDLGVTTQNWLGRSRWPNDAHFDGLLDDFRIYDRVLTQAEILETMRGDALIAWKPSPRHGSTLDVEHALPLSWLAGDRAEQHDVYFGTDQAAVADANEFDTTGVYQGRQPGTTFTPSEALEWGQTYYWRIDEYNANATISKGMIWSFTVADYLVVDDFEDYNNTPPYTVWNAWQDGFGDPGNGSQVGHDGSPYAEQTVVNSGTQSMPVYYDNSTAGLSEATETLISLRDWTDEGVEALTLWFRGYPAAVGGFIEGPAGTYTMTAAGADIGGEADEFHFAYLTLTGVGSVEAQVLSVDETDAWAKAGVMIRETLAPGSKFVAAYVTPGNGVRFQLRRTAGDDAEDDEDVVTDDQTEITAPYWVRLERTLGGDFRASYSSNGSDWQPMAYSPQNFPMNTIVHIGFAVSPNNTAETCEAVFSDVTIEGDVTTEWMHQDIGITTNDGEQLYVAVANNAATPAVVYYDEPNATQIDAWTEWNIDLKDFEVQGVDLGDVNSIAVGIGNKADPQAGGEGIMYFDDIRLYRPRCVPDKLELAEADLNSDCVVDRLDIEIMAGDWLVADDIVATAAPSADGLVGHWTLDGNADDNSGSGNHGTPRGKVQWISAGQIGGAVELDGNNDYIDLPIGSLLSSLTDCTIATWVNWTGQGTEWQRVFDFGTGETVYMYLTPSIAGNGPLRFAITTTGGSGGTEPSGLNAPSALSAGWHHVAVTIDATSMDMELYLDGVVANSGTTETIPADLGETTQNWLGRSQWIADPNFAGYLDDFRIYNQALSSAEIAYLADMTPDDGQLYAPVPSAAELSESEPQGSRSVDLKDFAVLADAWLDEQLWPQPQ